MKIIKAKWFNHQYLQKKSDKEIADIAELAEIIESESPEYAELVEEYERVERKLQQFEIESYLSEPEDSSDAVLEIHSGAGGTECATRPRTKWRPPGGPRRSQPDRAALRGRAAKYAAGRRTRRSTRSPDRRGPRRRPARGAGPARSARSPRAGTSR